LIVEAQRVFDPSAVRGDAMSDGGLRRLDRAQEAAAASSAPATLVLAGPGSGKTLTLTRRVELLVERGVEPRRILALTFTRGAAGEMERRINRALGLGALAPDDLFSVQQRSERPRPSDLSTSGIGDRVQDRVQVRTFHSWGLSLIKEDPRRFGVVEDQGDGSSSGLVIWDDEARREALSSSVGRAVSDSDLNRVDGLRERGDSACAVDRAGWAGVAGEALERALIEAGALDMVALVSRIVSTCQADERFCSALVGRYDHLLVDEYQDVSPVQEALVKLFFDRGVTVWAVGDDDQTLYGFRSADVRHITEFGARYPGAAILALSHNYRSTPPIVAASAALIGHNKLCAGKAQQSVETGPDVVLRGYDNAEAELWAVAHAIGLMVEAGVSPAAIAVLTRTRAIAESFAELSVLDSRCSGVEVTTVHGAKGREWEYVFVVALEDDVLPHRDSPDLEEERRILFVALTRAKFGLAMTFSASRKGRPSSISRFVAETGVQPVVGVDRLMGLTNDEALAPSAALTPAGARVNAYASRGLATLRAGSLWDETDDARLLNMFEGGVPIGIMADRLGRPEREVSTRIERLGRASPGEGARVILLQERRARA
jgi:superfamily I DNA/RNA helicase